MKKMKPVLRVLRIILFCMMAAMCMCLFAGVPISMPRVREDAPIEVVVKPDTENTNKPATIDFQAFN
ncbi:hypothetical protein [Chitinophaga flava]|uniref:hypothetical protein n=1 Tax=Chitinophaga flava TaxID=2259036 RepID=UPI0011BDECDE|nr:hypothetical protein [Chitinophaga flava]